MSRDPDERTPEEIDPVSLAAEGEQAEPYGEAPLVARLANVFRRESVRRRLLAPIGVDALILVTNLITGVIVARALGPTGRGELTAILLISQIAAWSFSMGSTEAISYFQSRDPSLARPLLSSWLLATFALGLVSILVAELLLPVLFAAQTTNAIDLGRLYLAMIPVILFQGVVAGSLLADEDFNFYNLTRFVSPAVAAVSYGLLLMVDSFTVELALVANVVANVLTVGLMLVRTFRRYPWIRPQIQLLRRTMWYGVKAHAGSVGSIVNARLDLLIIPAFLSAASVGLYSVATNVSSILPVLTGNIAFMLLPVAARRQGSARTVILTMQATMVIAFVAAVPLMVLAPLALKVIYGGGFGGAVEPLRLLLPGAVAQAGVTVLWSGLLAAERPFLASSAIAPAAVATVISLIIFLPTYGINAAAIITTVVYIGELVALAILYRRTLKIRWRDFLVAPSS